MKCDKLRCAGEHFARAIGWTRFAEPFVMLAMRLWVGWVFWKSGVQKLRDWESTVSLFANDYKVPLLPPEIAAYMGTFFELACPVALALGFAARLACLPLLVMCGVIQSIYPNVAELSWPLILGAILCHGPGAFSLDWAVKRWWQKRA